MKQVTPGVIARICKGTYYGNTDIKDTEVSSITTDSRNLTPGGLFIAIKGEHADGNKFISGTYAGGALCCISELKPGEAYNSILKEKAYIQVKSCYQALKDIAGYYRTVCGTKIIGITGSVGKTTTKEMVASVLSVHFNTLKTQGNFNNEVGVPLTLFRLRGEHEIAVVEMGISGFGEMTRLSSIVKPDICIITNIGQCHLETLGDRDGVLKAKTEIFSHMAEDGKVYLNGDDDKLRTVTEVNGRPPVFFGIGNRHNAGNGTDGSHMHSQYGVFAENIENKGLSGTYFDAVVYGKVIHLHVPVPGMHMVTNALAAVAVATDLGMTPEEIAAGISRVKPLGGHSSVIRTDSLTIMDDCYNANPVSMRAAIDVLSSMDGRKTAIIGDMFELGTDEKMLHYDIGAYAVKKGIDCIVCIGGLAKKYAEGALAIDNEHNVLYYETTDKAIKMFPDIVKKGDSVLVKASHAMGFEKIVAYLEQMW